MGDGSNTNEEGDIIIEVEHTCLVKILKNTSLLYFMRSARIGLLISDMT